MDRFRDAQRIYKERPSGMIEDEVPSVLSIDSDASEWSTATEGSRGSEATGDTVHRNPDQDDDNQSQGTVVNNQDQNDNQPLGDVVRFNNEREEVSIERQQENRELANVVEEEVQETKFEVIEELEGEMTWNRDFVIGRFAKLMNDKIKIEGYGDKDYLFHVEEVVRPI